MKARIAKKILKRNNHDMFVAWMNLNHLVIHEKMLEEKYKLCIENASQLVSKHVNSCASKPHGQWRIFLEYDFEKWSLPTVFDRKVAEDVVRLLNAKMVDELEKLYYKEFTK